MHSISTALTARQILGKEDKKMTHGVHYTLNEAGKEALIAVIIDCCKSGIEPSAFFQDAEDAMDFIHGRGRSFEIHWTFTVSKRPEVIDVDPTWFDAVLDD